MERQSDKIERGMRSKAEKCSSGGRRGEKEEKEYRKVRNPQICAMDLRSHLIHLFGLPSVVAELVGFETKAARGGGRKRRKPEMETETDRESHSHSAQLMNVRRRVADPPQGAALITDGAWLGVVIESNDN